MLLSGQLPHRKSAGSTEVTEERRFRGQIQMSPAARRSMVRRSQGNRTEGKRAKGGGDVEVSCQLVSNQELYICRRNLTEPYFGESKKSLCELKTRHPKEKKNDGVLDSKRGYTGQCGQWNTKEVCMGQGSTGRGQEAATTRGLVEWGIRQRGESSVFRALVGRLVAL